MEVIQIWGEGSYLLSIMPKIKFHDKVGMGKRGAGGQCVHYDCTVYTACTVQCAAHPVSSSQSAELGTKFRSPHLKLRSYNNFRLTVQKKCLHGK